MARLAAAGIGKGLAFSQTVIYPRGPLLVSQQISRSVEPTHCHCVQVIVDVLKYVKVAHQIPVLVQLQVARVAFLVCSLQLV